MYASLLTKTACQHMHTILNRLHTYEHVYKFGAKYVPIRTCTNLRQQALLYKIFTKMHLKCPKFIKVNKNNAHINTNIKRITVIPK